MTVVPAGPALPPAQAEELTAVEPVRLPRSAIFADALVIARRNLTGIVRTPQLLVFATIQPVMFALLFRYVFGGAIHVPRDQLRGLPDSRHHRADGRVRRHLHRGRPVPGHEQRHHRPVPVLAHVPLGRARRKNHRRSGPQRLRGAADDRRRHCRRLPLSQRLRARRGLRPGRLLLGYTLSWVFAFIRLTVADPESAQLAGFLFVFPLVSSRPYQANTSKPLQSPGRNGWPSSGIPQAAARGCQAAHGGLKAPIWAMIAATSSAAHSSLILPSVTR